jgi:hypothetical protein
VGENISEILLKTTSPFVDNILTCSSQDPMHSLNVSRHVLYLRNIPFVHPISITTSNLFHGNCFGFAQLLLSVLAWIEKPWVHLDHTMHR